GLRVAYNNAAEFLSLADYKNVARWTDQIGAREPVKRGARVNRPFGDPATRVIERHDASDFDAVAEAPAA
ncbi:hypothetical protein ABTC20_18900, partial [Acinetobacter baumannii]